ncbi:unnamed protein product [Trifolium pratense]|uniref:Uncharacterized protein n=1 Tax=Trifolium pratense TaxID=57577 RepID=A0ACB0K1G8_TRIPR|nr:unnamed protein product [Trifolium pratense]
MSPPLNVQKIKCVIFDFGWFHSLMAFTAASFASLGISTTIISCLASKEVEIRKCALFNTIWWICSTNGQDSCRAFCPLSLANFRHTHHLKYDYVCIYSNASLNL